MIKRHMRLGIAMDDKRRLLSVQHGYRILAALLVILAASVAFAQDSPAVFINEIHYDDQGSDEGEAIEIAGPAGTNLTGWQLVLYNGANRRMYVEQTLAGTIPDLQNGFGTLSFDFDNIQNGNRDGITLVDASGRNTAKVTLVTFWG